MVRSGWVCPALRWLNASQLPPVYTKAHACFSRAALAQDPGGWAWLQPARCGYDGSLTPAVAWHHSTVDRQTDALPCTAGIPEARVSTRTRVSCIGMTVTATD